MVVYKWVSNSQEKVFIGILSTLWQDEITNISKTCGCQASEVTGHPGNFFQPHIARISFGKMSPFHQPGMNWQGSTKLPLEVNPVHLIGNADKFEAQQRRWIRDISFHIYFRKMLLALNQHFISFYAWILFKHLCAAWGCLGYVPLNIRAFDQIHASGKIGSKVYKQQVPTCSKNFYSHDFPAFSKSNPPFFTFSCEKFLHFFFGGGILQISHPIRTSLKKIPRPEKKTKELGILRLQVVGNLTPW